jgi:putative membrane protein
MSRRRTGLSFQRTRMSADRTLMSVIRTSLALITFGFTIYQFFSKVVDPSVVERVAAGREFGTALLVLGIAMLSLGIAYHIRFMLGLRRTREEMATGGLIHGESEFPPSLTLITAVVLLLVGLLAISSIAFEIGPFN